MAKVKLGPAGSAAVQRGQRKASLTKRAWIAQRNLTTMLPMLERFARAILRDQKVRVFTTHQASYTDGRDLYIQPPMMLGDSPAHSVGNCGIRDGETKRLICKACDVNEIVMSLLYHEVSHVAFGSNATPEKLGRTAVARLVGEWHPPQACDHGVEILEAMAQAPSYFGMMQCYDERLYIVANGLEDARVNASMLEARPGTKVMLDARTHSVFSGDLELRDGTFIAWRDKPIDAQVAVGMLLAASNYHKHLDVFHEDAQALLADEVLVSLAAKISTAPDVHHLIVHTTDVWRRFQELGIMVKDKCVPPPPEDEDQDDQDEPQPEEDGGDDKDMGSLGHEGQPSPSDGDGEGGSSADKEGEGKGGDGGNGADQQADKDPSAGGGPGSSPGPGPSGASSGDADPDSAEGSRDNGPSPDEEGDEGGQGGGDRVQDERDSGSEDNVRSGGSPSGDGHDEGEHPQGGDAEGAADGGDEPDGDEASPGGGLADGKGEGAAAGEEPEGADHEGATGEPADAEREGWTSEGGEGTGDGDRADDGSDGGDEGGLDSEASKVELGDGGSDEGDALAPGNFDPATVEELTVALQAASLHGMFEDENTENFAGGHSLLNEHPIDVTEATQWAAALALAGLQAAWFEGPSEEVGQVRIVQYGDEGGVTGFNERHVSDDDLMPSQVVVGPVVTRGRVAFSPNKRSNYENNLKSGKINGRALRRIPLGAEDIFRKRTVERKRSYHVIITMDVSGSTASEAPSQHYPDQTTLEMMQRSVFAQAEALSRLNISFEIWAHTADYFITVEEQTAFYHSGRYREKYPPMDVWLLQVKSATDKWDAAAKQRMHSLQPLGANLDGHTLQIMRKKADEAKRKFTDVVICYYTDGAMPAANAIEEGGILKAETELCRKKGHALLAVAAGTDSPKQWGFDTVQIDSDADLPKVMAQLERAIL